MTERLNHKRGGLYKDKIMCLVPRLFVLEKADYTYIYAVIPEEEQPTHLTVICSIPNSLQEELYKKKWFKPMFS